MIRKCAKQVMKAVISPLSHQSGAACPLSFEFSQQKMTPSSKETKPEQVLKQKTSPFYSTETGPSKSEPLEASESENCGSTTGRIHGFKGEQRSYFFVITGLLLLLNVAARLTIEHEAHFHSYQQARNE